MTNKIVLELKNMPKKGDILVFDGERFEAVSIDTLNAKINSKINETSNRVTKLEENVKVLKGED